MNVGEIKQLSCGVIKDVDGEWTISINYGGAASFTTFKGTMLTFKPQIADAGNYDMCFNITDDNPIPKYKAYLFSVKVNEVKAVVQQMNTTDDSLAPPSVFQGVVIPTLAANATKQ